MAKEISLPEKMSRKQHFMMTPIFLILYSKCILVKAETITPLEQWEEGICVIHTSHDGLSNFLHNLWLQHSLVLVIIGTVSRELYTYCSLLSMSLILSNITNEPQIVSMLFLDKCLIWRGHRVNGHWMDYCLSVVS